jgi:hypothetical protein
VTENNDTVERARQRLVAMYGLGEDGIWAIHGEDPNCDMGGSHIEPHLETVEGQYGDIVDYALALPGFFNWGHGGSIRRIEIKRRVDAELVGQRAELLKRRAVLQKELDEIDSKL